MLTRSTHRPAAALAPVVTAVLVLGLLASGCSDDGSTRALGPDDAPSSGESSAPIDVDTATAEAPEAPEGDAGRVTAAVKQLPPLLATLREEYGATVDLLVDAVQAPEDDAAVLAADTQAQVWSEAATAYQDAVESASTEVAAVGDPGSSAAFDAYESQALALTEEQGEVLSFNGSYVVCNRALQIGLLDRSEHDEAAGLCRQSLEPVAASGDPLLVDYTEAMTRLMERRGGVFTRFDRLLRRREVPDPDNLTAEDLNRAGDDFGQIGRAAERSGDQLVAAFEDFLPALEALTTGGGLERKLDAASPDDAYADLLAAVGPAAGD